MPSVQGVAAFIVKSHGELLSHFSERSLPPSHYTNGPHLGDEAMQDRSPPLRLIRSPEPDKDSGPLASSKTGTEPNQEAPSRERVAGRRLIGFLSQFADSIDNDIKNIMDL